MIGNPGTSCDKEYAVDGGFDLLCTSENKWGDKLERPAWEGPDVRAKFGALIHGVADRDALAKAFDRATSEGFSFLLISDQTGTGKDVLWTRLPNKSEIWRPLVQRIKDWNKAARAKK
jgi:hypothetical protein